MKWKFLIMRASLEIFLSEVNMNVFRKICNSNVIINRNFQILIVSKTCKEQLTRLYG